MERLEVIFKVAERCNIDCNYCYVFNGADSSYRLHPKVVPETVVEGLNDFLVEGAAALGLTSIQVDLHGGEPLLIGKERFANICTGIHRRLASRVDLQIALQTNAMLIDPEWLDLFDTFSVRTSISLDGPRDYHDECRVDFKGEGTYDRVIRGLEYLGHQNGSLRGIGVLCVINPSRSARRIYRHFVEDLGIRTMDFLLPDYTSDDHLPDSKPFAGFLCELFDEWMADDDPEIQVRVLNSVLSLLLGGRSRVTGYGLEVAPAITVASDGSLGPDDTLRGCGQDVFNSKMTIFDTSLEGFLGSSYFQGLANAYRNRAAECKKCCWELICGGGAMVNRYSRDRGFDNPSVYCADLQRFYGHAAATLVKGGRPLDDLINRLIPDGGVPII